MARSPYEVARTFSGSVEGDKKLDKFLNGDTAGMSATDYAWCARFVSRAASAAGVDVSQMSDMARSALKIGSPTDKPTVGDLVVLSRTNNPALGHVGFYEGTNPDGSVKVFGGNQGNMVKTASFPASRVLGYRTFGPGTGVDPAQQGEAPRGGSMNGGMGMSPTGVAGVAGPIQTQEAGHAVADQPAFKDFQTTVTPAPAAPAGGGGPGITPDFNMADLAGSLGQFGSKIGEMLAANTPKPPSVNLVRPAGPRVDLNTIMQVLARRQRKGNGNMGGGDYGIG